MLARRSESADVSKPVQPKLGTVLLVNLMDAYSSHTYDLGHLELTENFQHQVIGEETLTALGHDDSDEGGKKEFRGAGRVIRDTNIPKDPVHC